MITLRFLGFAAALSAALPASATVYDYSLTDFPETGHRPTFQYGLRYDSLGHYFSFHDVRLRYDDEAGVAVVEGALTRNRPAGGLTSPPDTWTIDYTLDRITDLGDGRFEAQRGTGTLQNASESFDLMGKSNGDYVFAVLSGMRGVPGLAANGWLAGSPPPGADAGANDMLAGADLAGGVGEIPLPASLWFGLAAAAALLAAGRAGAARPA